MSDERQNKEIDTRIGKPHGVLHEVCHSVVTEQDVWPSGTRPDVWPSG